MQFRTVRDATIEKGARVIVRADFNVALRDGAVRDDFRIRESLTTLRFLLARGARIRLLSHLGRPAGKRVASLSLKPVGEALGRLLKKKVIFVTDPFVDSVFRQQNASEDILLFENIRFWQGEEENDPRFARALARWGDYYVNEAFAASHRSHASLVALPGLLLSCAGLNFEREIAAFARVVERSVRPLVVIIGGVKIEAKLPAVRRFLNAADQVLVGGAIANELLAQTPRIKNKKLHLPIDGKAQNSVYEDIGPKTIKMFQSFIAQAGTIIWNGPLGKAETPSLARGTRAVAKAIQRSSAFTVVGGGDTIAILRQYRLLRGFSHVSSGGGAMLEFLAGKKLPGIEALKE